MAKKQILLLEDETPLRRLYREVLMESGYAVRDAANGQEALKILRKHRCDLAVVDIHLAGSSGLEIIPQLLELQADLKIIIYSAYAVYKQDFRAWAADAYVLKSSNPERLLQTVERILAQEPLQ